MSSEESSSSHLQMEEDKFPDLQRFPPNMDFVNAVPAQAQKGFRNIQISFKCIDVCEQYLAVGTNIGVVYLYDRQKKKLHKLRNNDYTDPITCVKVLVSLECLVAVGTAKGTVFAFKVPFQDDTDIEKFKVEDLHHSSITSLEWVKNGIKLFSGDLLGVVVCTEIDHLEHHSWSKILLNETSKIIQLNYTSLMLLVSTLQRSVLYDFKKNESFQVGQKDRKSPGVFGATFFNSGFSSVMYLSRPGQRIWKSDETGIISETIVLKSVFSKVNNGSYKDFQFGLLHVYFSDFLLTWSNNRIVLINPEGKTIKSIGKLMDIVDVKTCNDEIFILQGYRNVVRFAILPEAEEQFIYKVENNDNYLLPMGEFDLINKKDTKQDEDSDSSESANVFNWIKRKFSEVTRDENCEIVPSQSSTALPDIVSLETNFPNVEISPEPVVPFSLVTKNNVNVKQDEEIVFKPKKGRKKKKKKNVSSNPDNDPVENNQEPPTPTSECSSLVDDSSLRLDDNSINGDNVSINTNSSSINVDSNSMNVDNSSMNIDNSSVNSVNMNDSSANATCSPNDLNCDSVDSSNANPSDNIEEHRKFLLDKITSSIIVDVNVESNLSVETDHQNNSISPPNSPDIYSEFSTIFSNDSTDVKKDELVDTSEQSCTAIMSESVESSDSKFPKYGVECVQYKSPGVLLSLSASNNHVFCTDSQNNLYMSEFPKFDFHWIKLDQPAEQVSVTPSESVLWVLHRGTAYAASRKHSNDSWKDAKWTLVAKSLSFISVSEPCAWCITWEGNLSLYQNFSSGVPYTSGLNVPCPFNVVQVACKNDLVWILTDEGKVYHHVHNSDSDIRNVQWKEIQLSPELSIGMISFGAKDVLYIIDADGILWFREEVNSLNPSGINDISQVESSSYVFESTGKVLGAVRKVVAANTELLTSFIKGVSQGILASSEAGIWWGKSMDAQILSYQKFIIGHSWEYIIPSGTVSTTKWNRVAVEGCSEIRDIYWGSTAAGELMYFSLKLHNCIAVSLPNGTFLQCLQSIDDALWILTTDGDIFIRRDMSIRSPHGIWWQKLDMSQLYDVRISHISCSLDVVWACDNDGKVFVRLGDLHPAAGTSLNQAWIQVDLQHSVPVQQSSTKSFVKLSSRPKNIIISKVYVGIKSYMVWALTKEGLVYARNGISPKLIIGEEWLLVPGPRAKQLCISSNAVWLLKYSGKIFRRFGISKSNPTGDYWKQIPGKLSFLSVTADDDLWGIQENCLCHHSSHAITFEGHSNLDETDTKDVSDDDWEDIAAGLSDND